MQSFPCRDQFARRRAPEISWAPTQDAQAHRQRVIPGEGARLALASWDNGGFGAASPPPKVVTRRSASAVATGSIPSCSGRFATSASLQATTAHQIGVNDILLVAANTSGGVTGKMISPQSIAVACAATGLVGKESDLFRFTLKHSLFFATIVGLITLAQAYWFTGMLVH